MFPFNRFHFVEKQSSYLIPRKDSSKPTCLVEAKPTHSDPSFSLIHVFLGTNLPPPSLTSAAAAVLLCMMM